ncbi:MAG: carbon storage regulator [Planctomycetota bacterium]
MLVLTRKTDEAIYIGDNIKITLVRIKGGSVRIGIDAPEDVQIKRAELRDRPATGDSSGNDAGPNLLGNGPDLRALGEILKSSKPSNNRRLELPTRETRASDMDGATAGDRNRRRNHIPRPALEKFMSA